MNRSNGKEVELINGIHMSIEKWENIYMQSMLGYDQDDLGVSDQAKSTRRKKKNERNIDECR